MVCTMYCVCKEACFSKTKFTNSLSLRAWLEKTVYEVETHWLSGKGKIQRPTVSKEGYAGNKLIWDITDKKINIHARGVFVDFVRT